MNQSVSWFSAVWDKYFGPGKLLYGIFLFILNSTVQDSLKFEISNLAAENQKKGTSGKGKKCFGTFFRLRKALQTIDQVKMVWQIGLVS